MNPGLKILLFPIAFTYGVITLLRNSLYDGGFLKVTRFDEHTIGVGNLWVGGAGKTPLVEYLIKLLKQEEPNLATLSRGYKRKTSGFLIADENSTAEDIGDEPLIYKYKYNVKVAVDGNRVNGGLNPELVLVGRQSIDYDSAQIGPMLAELLDLPVVSFVTSFEINGTTLRAERDVEGGKEVVETTLPCIITAQKGLNEPRYPKLPDIMKAKAKPIEERPAANMPDRTQTVGMRLPEKKQGGKILEFSPVNVRELVRLLHEEAKVI